MALSQYERNRLLDLPQPDGLLDLQTVERLAQQISKFGTFHLTDSAENRVAVVLEIPLLDGANTPVQWARRAAQRGIHAVIAGPWDSCSCHVILPLDAPMPEAEAQKLGESMVELFGGESFETVVFTKKQLTIELESEVAMSADKEGRRADAWERAWHAAKAANAAKEAAALRKAGEQTHPLEELNKVHAIVHVKGVAAVLTEHDGGVSLTDEARLHPRYANDLRSKDGKVEPISKFWFRWKERRTYSGGLGFWPDPSRAPVNSYNLWPGWSVEPDPAASCSLFLDHLRTIVCRGNEAHLQWLLGWLAHLVQRPGEKPRSAIILKGAKGAGKDTVGEYVAKLLPRPAYLNTSDPSLLVGQFNALVANKLLLHMEEGFWSGDRSFDSRLKNLITAPTLTINEKYQIPYEVDSFHRLIITSNEARVVNATEGERRYFIVELDPARAKDAAYFNALREEMNGAGPAALMHFLRGLDLSAWRHEPPVTETLREHIVDGLRGIPAWWCSVLREGGLPGTTTPYEGGVEPWDKAPQSASVAGLYEHYRDWVRSRRYEGDPANDGTFARELRKICGRCLTVSRHQQEGVRQRHYKLAALGECRAAFEQSHGAGDWS